MVQLTKHRVTVLGMLVISYPQDPPGVIILRKFLRIFAALGIRTIIPGPVPEQLACDHWYLSFPEKAGTTGYVTLQLKLAILLARRWRSWDRCCLIVGGTVMVLPIMLARMLKRPVYLIVTGSAASTAKQQYGPRSPRTIALMIAERVSFKLASSVITYNDSAAKYLQIDRIRPDVVTTGAEFVEEDFRPTKRLLRDRPFAIGFVGRLSPEKGILNLLDAMKLLAREFPDLILDIVGDGSLMEELKRIALTHPLGKRLRVLGWIGQQELPSEYNEIRLLVLPSFTEGLPKVMLEAMACGTPVLATRVGGVPDVVEGGVNGFLLDENSPKSLADAMRAILSMQIDELERIAGQARMTIEKSFGFSQAVERYATIFRI